MEAPEKAMPAAAPFTLDPLPYDINAFGDAISARTFVLHHDKHHSAYVSAANQLAADAGLADEPAVTIIQRTAGDPAHQSLFNNAAQAWNHDFYWKSITPHHQRPKGVLDDQVKAAFGNWEGLAGRLADAAVGQFGSGWVWIVKSSNGALEIETTSNAQTPIAAGRHPLLVIDVWEHAYYLDHENLRRSYAEKLIDKHLNWAFAFDNYHNSPLTKAR